ncbi:MAG: amidohydrolase family protein, partial [Deltaproteobacteria bacterium]|nr:amidohydrolase family protein [Deltaproteobacteria bacterium]
SHVHLTMSGSEDSAVRERQLSLTREEAEKVIAKHLTDHLAHGIVAVRDGGDHAGHTLHYKKAVLPGQVLPIYLCAAGKAWHAAGRYGRLVGEPPLRGESLAQSITRRSDGIGHIKIVNSGLNSLTRFGRETPPQFHLGEFTSAVMIGKDMGLKTMVHANGKEPVRIAIEAGCDSIEHGFFMGRENIALMAEKGVTWVPTAHPMAAYARIFPRGSSTSDMAKRNLEHQLTQIRIAAEYGVPMALGTDAGSPGVHHGRAVREEMAWWVDAGLGIERVVHCAAAQGARLLGLEDRIGRLLPGMPATFLVTRGKPEDVTDALACPERIYINGTELAADPHLPAGIGRADRHRRKLGANTVCRSLNQKI